MPPPQRVEKGENPLDGQRGKSVKGGRRAPLSRAVGNFFDCIEKVRQAVIKFHWGFLTAWGGARDLSRVLPFLCPDGQKTDFLPVSSQ